MYRETQVHVMISKRAHKQLTWVDLESPTLEEIRTIQAEYGIHPLIANELAGPSLKPKVDLYDDFIYLILHFPSLRELRKTGKANKEVDFIIGKNVIITAHYTDIDALHAFSKTFEVHSILDKSDMGHAGFIFFHMVRKAYELLMNDLEKINGSLESIQREIFNGKEREMVKELSDVSRELLDFTRATKLHREVLESFEIAGKQFFGDAFSYHLRAITGEYYRIEDMLGSHSEFLRELRETNNSLLSTKQNETMKTLTIAAFLSVPLAFITQVFGMNTNYLPIVGHPYDFWLIIALMAAIVLFMVGIFKHKNWL